MNHEKTFEAINKLKDIELELHRLKNALEMTNKALDTQRQWVGLTDEEIDSLVNLKVDGAYLSVPDTIRQVEAKLKEKNT